jgi:RimM protein, required for 16S rRNA processing
LNNLLSPNYQPIAKISRSFGLSGEVQLKPTSRYFEKYIKCSELFISHKDSNPIPIEIISVKGAWGKRSI